MSKSDNRIRTSKRNFLIALTLLLVTNVLTSITLMSMAKRSLREQIEQRMLDITNTAASQINGDVLRELKAEDKGTENYERILDILRVYQDNIKLESGGTLRYTVGSFTVGNWECWQGVGIAPDVEVKMDSALIGTDEDTQLQKAIDLLS